MDISPEQMIAVAESHLAEIGRSTDGYRPRFFDQDLVRDVEVTFLQNDGSRDLGPRVFLTQFGDLLGILLPDGKSPDYLPGDECPRVKGEESIDAARRYLMLHGFNSAGLVGEVAEPANLSVVFYEVDSDQLVMGGGGAEVYIVDGEHVVRVWHSQ